MNIQADEWCHKKVVECITQINDYQETLTFMPTKLEFKEISLETPGYFSSNEIQGENCESTYTLEATIDHINDMESLIKKNFLTPVDKIQEMYDANPVQKTLREEIEEMKIEIITLKSQNKKLIDQVYSKDKDNDSKN